MIERAAADEREQLPAREKITESVRGQTVRRAEEEQRSKGGKFGGARRGKTVRGVDFQWKWRLSTVEWNENPRKEEFF